MNRSAYTTTDVRSELDYLQRKAQQLADTLQASADEPMTSESLLKVAERVAILRGSFTTMEEVLVGHARDAGASWAHVGFLMGMTRQSAHQRFARLDRDDATPHPQDQDVTTNGPA